MEYLEDEHDDEDDFGCGSPARFVFILGTT
jgi:hypothetical protein